VGSISSLKKSIDSSQKKVTELTIIITQNKKGREKLLVTALFLSLHLSLSVLLDIYKYTHKRTRGGRKKNGRNFYVVVVSRVSEVKKERAQSRFYLHVYRPIERENL
jgi:hypothetical protein